MDTVIHRTRGSTAPYELDYRTDVDLAEYPVEDWIHNPVVPETHPRLWKIEDGVVVEITPTERDARRAEIVEWKITQEREQLKARTEADARLMAIVSLMMDEINILRVRDGLGERTFQDYKDQIKQRIDSLS